MFDLFINNFRSFQNQDLKFSRVNILIGENSGGKSSLIKFLLALKQTNDNFFESNFKLKGDYTDLGNYREVIYNNDPKNNLEFKFTNRNSYIDYYRKEFYTFNKKNKENKIILDTILKEVMDMETSISFVLNDKLDDHFEIKCIIENSKIGKIELLQKKNKDEELSSYRKLVLDVRLDDFKEKFEVNGIKEGFFTMITGDLSEIIAKLFDNTINSNYIYNKIGFLLLYQNFLQKTISNFRYVNPIISSPKRFYFQEDKKANYNHLDLENFINIIGDKNLPQKSKDSQLASLNKLIKDYGIADEIRVVNHPDIPILTLEVKTKGYWSNITDVGYGVSLQIPILFQALISEKYSKTPQTILIEQPEVHVHPRLQSKFIETILSIGRKNSYFIETHSDDILRKLQVMVKKNMFGLKSDDVTIHYFKRGKDRFEISQHTISEFGSLDFSLPSGFYDNSYNLVKELL